MMLHDICRTMLMGILVWSWRVIHRLHTSLLSANALVTCRRFIPWARLPRSPLRPRSPAGAATTWVSAEVSDWGPTSGAGFVRHILYYTKWLKVQGPLQSSWHRSLPLRNLDQFTCHSVSVRVHNEGNLAHQSLCPRLPFSWQTYYPMSLTQQHCNTKALILTPVVTALLQPSWHCWSWRLFGSDVVMLVLMLRLKA